MVHQPPHAGGLSSLGDLGIHIIIMIYHEISYIKKTFAGNAINIIWPEHVKITVEEGQGIYIYIYYLSTYVVCLFVSLTIFGMVSIEDVFETVVSDMIPTDDFFSWLNHQPAYRNICF